MRLLCGHNTRGIMVTVPMTSIASMSLETSCIEVWDLGGKCTEFKQPEGFKKDAAASFTKLLCAITELDGSILLDVLSDSDQLGIVKLGSMEEVHFK